MQNPIKEILVNSRLQYRAYLYSTETLTLSLPHPLTRSPIRPASASHCKYALSLLPALPKVPHPAAIFAWSSQTQPQALPQAQPQDCIEQPDFVNLMQDTIQSAHQELRYLLSARAKRQGEGYLALVDERAPMVWGRAAESDDTIGMCRVEGGELDVSSYEPMPTFRLVSRLGIFSLPKPLYTVLMARLAAL